MHPVLRIALNHTRYGPAGGVEGYLRRLVEHLLRRGCDVHFFGRRAEPVDHERFHFHPVRCLPFPHFLTMLSFAGRSARALRAHSFDLTFGFGRTFGHDLHRDSSGAFDAFRSAVRTTFRRPPWYCRAATYLERTLYTSPELRHTMAVSAFVEEQIRRRYALVRDRISVNYNGVDATRFSSDRRDGSAVRADAGCGPERRVALFVGNDWRRKGLGCALEGIRRAKPAWDLWVVGEDARGGGLRRYAAELGIADRVRFFGRRETPAYYSAADAFVFPSLFDPLSNVVLEAMASALPAIVSPADGAAELIRPGENGFVLENASASSQVAAFLDRLADGDVRNAVGRRAAESVAPLTWERHFRELDRVIEAVRRRRSETGA